MRDLTKEPPSERASSTRPWRYAVVVGASSGIGEALARDLALGGTDVALVARRESELEHVRREIESMGAAGRASVFVHDVRDTSAAEPLLQQIALALGGLDLVIYASGIMPPIGADRYPTDDDVNIISTNLSGAIAWLNAAAVRFAAARSGTIIGISSIAGERGRRGNPAYGASKAGLSSYLQSLRARLAGRGVTVLTAKPGYVRTPLLGEGRTLLPAIPPEAAAAQILEAAAQGKREIFVPAWWRYVALIVRSIPEPIFERLPVP